MSDWNDGPPAKFERGMEVETGRGLVIVLEPEVADDVPGAYTSDGNFVWLSEVLRWRWPGPACERDESTDYDEDGIFYCGRCHRAMPASQKPGPAQPERSGSVEMAVKQLLRGIAIHDADVALRGVEALEDAVRADERAKLEQAHKARLREEIEMAWSAGEDHGSWETYGPGGGPEPTTLQGHLRSRGLEADDV